MGIFSKPTLERTVAELASSTKMCGWLDKQPQGGGKKWQKRYFVLTGVAIYYFESPEVRPRLLLFACC